MRRTSVAGSPSTAAVGVVAGLLLTIGAAGIAMAPSAAAVDDPTRPDARVTHGPSCRPGGLVIEVRAGTVSYTVRLATTRQPGGEDEAVVSPGATLVLRTADVAWGETIDGRLEFTARDGSGVTFADELDDYSFTRPSAEDCAAVQEPTQPHPPPRLPDGSAQAPGGGGAPIGEQLPNGGGGQVGSSGTADGTPRPTTAPGPDDPGAGSSGPGHPGGSAGAVVAGSAGSAGSASADQVAPGQTVTLDGTGFLPGERVLVQLAGGAVLTSATADVAGAVRAQVQIPEGVRAGPLTVTLVGDDSAAVAGIELLVAALTSPEREDGIAPVVPLVAAAGALVAVAAGLSSVAGRSRAPVSRGAIRGSA